MRQTKFRTRRAILSAATTAAIVGIAGCTGENEDTDVAEDELNQAADYIERNGVLLDEFEEAVSVSTSETSPNFEYTTFEQNIGQASRHVENAQDAAPDAYGNDIDFFRSVLDYQVEIGEANSLVEDYLNCLDTMDAMISADRWEDATDQHDDCVDTLHNIESQIEASVSALDVIDRSDLSQSLEFEYNATENELALVQSELPPIFDFHDGMQLLLEGTTQMMDSIDDFEDGETGAAKRGLARAEGDFADAESIYDQLEDNPDLSDDLRPDVIEMKCFVSAFEDASGHWYNAIEAYENRNESRYMNELDAVDAALQRCG